MQGKVVIVTGAFGALGRVVAARLAQAGALVALVDVAPSAPAEVAAIGLVLPGADISTAQGAQAVVDAVLAKFGRLDALANIAGGFRWQTVMDGDPAVFAELFALNVGTTLSMCRAAIPALIGAGGRIVNVGAGGAVKAGAGMGPYAVSKSGVHRLTEALAEELKGKVAVNAVLPSIIDTPANRADMPDADFAAWVTPAELAEVITFLASPAASGVTGALVPVSGRV